MNALPRLAQMADDFRTYAIRFSEDQPAPIACNILQAIASDEAGTFPGSGVEPVLKRVFHCQRFHRLWRVLAALCIHPVGLAFERIRGKNNALTFLAVVVCLPIDLYSVAPQLSDGAGQCLTRRSACH